VAKTRVKKAQKKVAKEAGPRNRAEAEAFIKRHNLEAIAPEAARCLRAAPFTE
jgi:hypothetical protein